jgi:collagenase-like PrtC family protease
MASLSHSSSFSSESEDIPVNHPFVSCFFEKLSEPWRILTTPFIRPEDLCTYKELGVSEIKLTDRFSSTDELVNRVEAYLKETYDGNLLDLLSFYPVKKDGSFKKRKLYIPKDKIKSLVKIGNFLKLSEAPEIYIDNKKLDGFLEFFIKNRVDCSDMACENCKWCQKNAEKSISYDKNKLLKFCKNLEAFNEKYLSLEDI